MVLCAVCRHCCALCAVSYIDSAVNTHSWSDCDSPLSSLHSTDCRSIPHTSTPRLWTCHIILCASASSSHPTTTLCESPGHQVSESVRDLSTLRIFGPALSAAMRPSFVAASSRRLAASCSCPAGVSMLRPLASSAAGAPLRRFAAIPTPVDRSLCADGVYRRPPVPMPRAPLGEDDHLVWHDGQAHEPALDRYAHVIAPRRALAQCVAAIVAVFGGAWAAVRYADTQSWQPTQRQQMPYQSLAVEFGTAPPQPANGSAEQPQHH